VSSDYSSILLQFRSRSKTAEERILCGQQVEAQLAGGLVTTRILLTTLAYPTASAALDSTNKYRTLLSDVRRIPYSPSFISALTCMYD
jgi:hypothetical protein